MELYEIVFTSPQADVMKFNVLGQDPADALKRIDRALRRKFGPESDVLFSQTGIRHVATIDVA